MRSYTRRKQRRHSGFGSFSVVSSTMVTHANWDANQLPILPRRRSGTTDRHDESTENPPTVSYVQTGRMANIREQFTSAGLSGTAVELLANSVKTSTAKLYNCSWAKWSRWCNQRQSNPILCPVEDVLTFLAEQYSERRVTAASAHRFCS